MGRNSGRLRQKIKEHKFQYKIKMKTLTSNKAFWLLLVICVVTILPFLGLSEYHTKGEPRESIVSYSMLDSGNWILPRNNGGEMAYKPPFFHWSIAAVSAAVNGGQVTEMTSRLPSAIALIRISYYQTRVVYAPLQRTDAKPNPHTQRSASPVHLFSDRRKEVSHTADDY